MCYALYLFNTDNYYYAKHSTAQWHIEAGEYGKNYSKDFQKFGELKAQEKIDSEGGVGENELAWSLSVEEREMIQNHLNNNKSLPDGYTIKTKVAEGKISSQPLSGKP